MAVEEGDFPLRAIDVQVPSQVEQGLSTPERPVGDPQRTAGTSATPTIPVQIAVGAPLDAQQENRPFLPAAFFGPDQNPLGDADRVTGEVYNDSDEENEELGDSGIGLIVDIDEQLPVDVDGNIASIEEELVLGSTNATEPEAEVSVPAALPPGAEPAFDNVDNPGEWPPDCFHSKFGPKPRGVTAKPYLRHETKTGAQPVPLGDDGRKVKGWDFCYRGWESDVTGRVGATEADPTPQSRKGSIKPGFYTENGLLHNESKLQDPLFWLFVVLPVDTFWDEVLAMTNEYAFSAPPYGCGMGKAGSHYFEQAQFMKETYVARRIMIMGNDQNSSRHLMKRPCLILNALDVSSMQKKIRFRLMMKVRLIQIQIKIAKCIIKRYILQIEYITFDIYNKQIWVAFACVFCSMRRGWFGFASVAMAMVIIIHVMFLFWIIAMVWIFCYEMIMFCCCLYHVRAWSRYRRCQNAPQMCPWHPAIASCCLVLPYPP